MNLNFSAIISQSFNIAWRYKSLWIFGLFTGFGSGGFNFRLPGKDLTKLFNGPFDLGSFRSHTGFDPDDLVRHFNMPLIMAIVGVALLLALIFFICYLIAQPAIIDAVNKITRGGQYCFGDSFSRGVDFFWRFLGLSIAAFMTILAVVFAVVLLAMISLVTLLLTIPAAIIFGFFVWHTFGLARVAMVARDNTIGDAIIEGWDLMTRNKLNCLLASLIMIGITIGFAIIIGIVALITFVPLGLAVALISGNLIAVLLIGLVLGLPISVVLGGFTGTFFNAFYVQFYFNLYEPGPAPSAGTLAPAV